MPRDSDPNDPSHPELRRLHRRLDDLHDRVHELARDQRRLHRRMTAVLERLDGGPAAGGDGGDGSAGGGEDRPPVGAPPPPLWRRVAKRGLRATVGTLRRVWRSADPDLPEPFELLLGERPAAGVPALAPSDAAAAERLPGSWRELVRLTVAAEELDFLELRTAGGTVRFDRERPGDGSRKPRVGKVVDLAGDGETEPGDPAEPGVRVEGPYRVAGLRPGVGHRHRLRPLPPPEPTSGDRDGVLIVPGSPLHSGLDLLAADLLRGLGDRLGGRDPRLATLAPSGELQRRRLAELARLAPVHPLADFLAPGLLPSALRHLAGRHRIGAVLHLGDRPLADEIAAAVADLDPPPRIVDRPRRGPVQEVGVDVDDLRRRLDPAAGRRLRGELGVPEGAVLVTLRADLVAGERPEDFLALAHRFAGDADFCFLLVGTGPRAATLDDLERYLAPPRFRRRDSLPLPDLLAATDVACLPGEAAERPYFLLAALAAGVPAVATDAGGGELLAEGPCGITAPSGELAAFEQALRRLADLGERRHLGERGPELVASRFRLERALDRYADLLRNP